MKTLVVRIASALCLLLAGIAALGPVMASAETVGFRDFAYGSSASAPTGQKPQSKLWFADGQWWGSLFNAATTDFEIYRYDWPSHTWTTTRTVIDERAAAFMDTLWDGTHLYVATAGASTTTSSHQARIVRYTYSSATRTFSRDPGFPVAITNAGVKSVVLEKDSTGVLWATYTQAGKVWILHSTLNDATWTTPYTLPAPGAANIGTDEIAAVVHYDGNKIGVMWSNQNDHTMYFASHLDGAPDDAWVQTAAYQRPEGADDHMNLKSLQADDSGRVFAAVKTSLDASTDPLIHLLVLRPDSTWTSHTFGTVGNNHTRAIVLIDSENRQLYMFAAAPCCSGGVVYMKQSGLDNISFPAGMGTPFIQNSTDLKINNPTSTKQNLSSATGLLVMAGDDSTRYYVHNRLSLASRSTTTTADTTTTTADTTTTTADTTTTTADTTTTTTTSSTSTTTTTTTTQPPPPAGRELFVDNFETGNFENWNSVVAEGGGTASVVAGAGAGGTYGAQFTGIAETKTVAYARADLGGSFDALTMSGNVRFTSEGGTNGVPMFRVFDGSGNRLVTVQRRGGDSDRIQVAHSGGTFNTTFQLPLDRAADVSLHLVVSGTDASRIELRMDGVVVYSTTTADITAGAATVQIGSDSRRLSFTSIIDDVRVVSG